MAYPNFGFAMDTMKLLT